jgi:hypothetical protein
LSIGIASGRPDLASLDPVANAARHRGEHLVGDDDPPPKIVMTGHDPPNLQSHLELLVLAA